MKFISSDIVRTYDPRMATLSQTKRIIMYYYQTKNLKDVKKYYNIYRLNGGKMTLKQIVKEVK